MLETAAHAVHALGLYHGPVHIELRYDGANAWILETAARPIGGLCAKTLRFSHGIPLEELIVRHALGEDVSAMQREASASGVMMIPIPKAGIYESVSGVEDAPAEVIITAQPGQRLVPLPEGASYLGFIFARAATVSEVETALRQSHAALRFQVATALDTFSPSL